jgi:hypothetical protein
MKTKKSTVVAKKTRSPGSLSDKELRLVDAMVATIQEDDFHHLDLQSWNEARENLKKVPLAPNVRPELRKALGKAVKSLEKVPAPTLKNLLALWHGATAYRASHSPSRSK